MPDFGVNGGGLTAREFEILLAAMRHYSLVTAGRIRVLELGHYCGQSTHAIFTGLWAADDDFVIDTIDHYQGDACMPEEVMADARDKFAVNHAELMDERVVAHEGDMDTMDPEGYGAVFYDADHGDRQVEYIKRVDATESVSLVVMDDVGLLRKLGGPDDALAFLLSKGWCETGPPRRGSKSSPGGNSLAVLVR